TRRKSIRGPAGDRPSPAGWPATARAGGVDPSRARRAQTAGALSRVWGGAARSRFSALILGVRILIPSSSTVELAYTIEQRVRLRFCGRWRALSTDDVRTSSGSEQRAETVRKLGGAGGLTMEGEREDRRVRRTRRLLREALLALILEKGYD